MTSSIAGSVQGALAEGSHVEGAGFAGQVFVLGGQGDRSGLEELVNGRTLDPMPRVEAAFLRAAAVHDSAAVLHDRAAELFETLGKPELAAGERERARADRGGAAADRDRARLRHDWLASHRG